MFLACCPWPAVMDLPSEVHVHSYRGSCTEIAAGSKPFIATGAAPRLSQCHDLEKLLTCDIIWPIISYDEGPQGGATFIIAKVQG